MHPEKGPAVEHTAGPEECGLFVAGEVGDAVKALLQVGVGGDAVGHLAVVEQWVRANERHPETYVSRCCFLAGAGGLREPRRKGARVAAPSGCIVPWAARASCWPQPQQLLPVSAAGSGRRCCTGAFFPAGLFGGSMLFSSTLVVRYKVQIKQKLQRHNNAGVLGGRGWIRTTIFSVCLFLPCQKMQHSSRFSGTAWNARCTTGTARTLKVGCKVGYFSGPGAYSDSTPETACAVASSRPVTAWEYQP